MSVKVTVGSAATAASTRGETRISSPLTTRASAVPAVDARSPPMSAPFATSSPATWCPQRRLVVPPRRSRRAAPRARRSPDRAAAVRRFEASTSSPATSSSRASPRRTAEHGRAAQGNDITFQDNTITHPEYRGDDTDGPVLRRRHQDRAQRPFRTWRRVGLQRGRCEDAAPRLHADLLQQSVPDQQRRHDRGQPLRGHRSSVPHRRGAGLPGRDVNGPGQSLGGPSTTTPATRAPPIGSIKDIKNATIVGNTFTGSNNKAIALFDASTGAHVGGKHGQLEHRQIDHFRRRAGGAGLHRADAGSVAGSSGAADPLPRRRARSNAAGSTHLAAHGRSRRLGGRVPAGAARPERRRGAAIARRRTRPDGSGPRCRSTSSNLHAAERTARDRCSAAAAALVGPHAAGSATASAGSTSGRVIASCIASWCPSRS